MLTEELMREVRRLRVSTSRRVDDLFAGEYQSAFKGQGIEFAEVREYEPGDDVRSIDWNVTARAGKPFIKRFVEERQLTVVFAVDTSASSLFGTVGRTKARLLAEAGAAISLAAQTKRVRIGFMRFSDAVDLWVAPGRGPRHLLRIIRELVAAEPAGTGAAFPEAVERLSRLLKRRAVIFLASDWLLPPIEGDVPAPPARLETALKVLTRRNDVIALRAADRRDADIPALGLVAMRDPETGRTVSVDTASKRVRAHLRDAHDAQQRATDALLRRTGVDLVDLATDRPFVTDLLRYFRLREQRR
ncbi:MAG: DUF58 domain-containing protein [Planctomycetota bacterium]